MRILQVCKKTPIPAKDGEALAILNLTKLLVNKGATITLLAIATPKHNNNSNQLSAPLKSKVAYKQCFVNTNFKAVNFISSFIKNESYTLQRFYCKKFQTIIVEELQSNNYDIVQLEGLYLVSYLSAIKKHSNAKIVLRAHNIEHDLWNKLAQNMSNIIKKKLYQRNAKELEKAQLQSFSRLDAIVSISTADETYFNKKQQHAQVHNLPFGIDINNYKTAKPSLKNTLAFIGSLDWLPNLEGLHWFLKIVWPIVLKTVPTAEFYIAGRNLKNTNQFKQYQSINIVGEVDDAKDFIATHPIFVVPLLSGSGMRIKIIEAMALKRAVVSTNLGAAGINFTHKTNIEIADTASSFANAIIFLLKNELAINTMGKNAHKLVINQYNNDTLGDQLIQFYNSLIL